MIIKSFNYETIRNAIFNRQHHIAGNNAITEPLHAFFILQIAGTNIVLKDASGATIWTSPTSVRFSPPVRLDGGFQVSGTAIYTSYSVLPLA